MIVMRSNTSNGLLTMGDGLELDVVVEDDDGVFLAVTVLHDEDGDEVVEMVSSDPSVIEAFFEDVRRAETEWQRLRG